MARDISFMQYMRAHGNTPSPTQRPVITGVVCGLIAAIPYVLVLHFSDALESSARTFGVSIALGFVVAVLLSVAGGMIYAWIFKRAANDVHGGWMFGMSYGFLLWVLGPVALWQAVTSRPVAVGTPAIGMFLAQILYGLVLGLVFPWVHDLIKGNFSDVRDDVKVEEKGPEVEK